MMNATTQENFLVREEPIERLERVVFALSEACREYGSAQEKTRSALTAALAAECAGCGIRVSGEELLALSQLPSALETSSRIKWLRLGCCARNGCDSRAYLMIFQHHPDLDWRELFSKIETSTEKEAATPESETESDPYNTPEVRRERRVLKISLAVAVAILLYLLHQWYYGGRIPLIREPEHFNVTPAPTGIDPR